MTIKVLGQICPFCSLADVSGIDGLRRIDNICHFKRFFDGFTIFFNILCIGANQFDCERLPQAICILIVHPLLLGSNLGGHSFMCVGDFSGHHRGTGRAIHCLDDPLAHHVVAIFAGKGKNACAVSRIDLGRTIRIQFVFLPIITIFIAIGIMGRYAAYHVGPAFGITQLKAGILAAILISINTIIPNGHIAGFGVQDFGGLIQLHINLGRTLSVTVVFVIPQFCHCHAVRTSGEAVPESQVVAVVIQFHNKFGSRACTLTIDIYLDDSRSRIIGDTKSVLRGFTDCIGERL